jgi:hypothetical protein
MAQCTPSPHHGVPHACTLLTDGAALCAACLVHRWSSYRKRATLTPTIQRHYREITLRPPQFADFLLSDAVGFASAERVNVPYDERTTTAGFARRPLWVFVK